MNMDKAFLYLRDHDYRLIAVLPEMIVMIYPTHRNTKTFISFRGDETPRLFSHSLDEITQALHTFYNAD